MSLAERTARRTPLPPRRPGRHEPDPPPGGLQRRAEEAAAHPVPDLSGALDVLRELIAVAELRERPQTPEPRGELDSRRRDRRGDLDGLVRAADRRSQLAHRHADQPERRARVGLVDAVPQLPRSSTDALGDLLGSTGSPSSHSTAAFMYPL